MSLLSPHRAVFGYAAALVIAGFVAGVVAGEFRKQVDAALREAELRAQVDRLEHDLAVARAIQQSLLPATVPDIAGSRLPGGTSPPIRLVEITTTGNFYQTGRW